METKFQGGNVMIVHAYREDNRCADALANFTWDMELKFINFEHPLAFVNHLLNFDVMGIIIPRFSFAHFTPG